MKSNALKIEVDEKSFSVWSRLEYSELESFVDLPPFYMEAALKKASQWMEGQQIYFFETYEDRLKSAWNALQRKGQGSIRVPLVQGVPPLRGLIVKPTMEDSSTVCTLTIDAHPADVAEWRVNWMQLQIDRKLQSVSGNLKVNRAQVVACRIHRMLDYEVVDRPMVEQPKNNPAREGQAFVVRIYDETGEVLVVAGSPEIFSEPDAQQQMWSKVREVSQRYVDQNGGFQSILLLPGVVQKTMRRYSLSLEGAGIGLPVAALVGVRVNSENQTWKRSTTSLLSQASLVGASTNNLEGMKNSWIESLGTRCDQLLPGLVQSKMIGVDDSCRYFGNPDLVRSQIVVNKQRQDDERHIEVLKYALDSLQAVKAKRRSVHGLTIGLPRSRMTAVSEKLQQFAEQTFRSTKDSQGDLYCFGTQCVQLTHPLGEYSQEKSHENQSIPSWLNTTIREMVGLKDFRPDPKWIMKRLYPKVDFTPVNRVLTGLKKAGLIEFDQKLNCYRCPDPNIQTEAEIKSANVMEFHKSILQVTQEIMEPESQQMVFASMFLCTADQETVGSVKATLNDFLVELMHTETHHGTAEDVFQINLQWVPMV